MKPSLINKIWLFPFFFCKHQNSIRDSDSNEKCHKICYCLTKVQVKASNLLALKMQRFQKNDDKGHLCLNK